MSEAKVASVFSFDDFRTWALADYGRAKATVYYNIGRLQSLQREGLDIDAFLASPKAARQHGNQVLANLKLQERTPNALRTLHKALNWLVDYGHHLRPDDAWKKWTLPKEPRAIPRTIDLDHVDRLWTEWTGDNEYATRFGRALAYVAYHGNFRRGELDRQRLAHLKPQTGQMELPVASKGSTGGLVELPWTAFWRDSPLIRYLQLRVDVADGDWLWTVPWSKGRPMPRRVRGPGLYRQIVRMGEDLGVSVNFIRAKRRALTDIDELSTDPRVTQTKARHASIDMTLHYLGRVTSTRQRRELAQRGVPGYQPELARFAVRDLPGSLGGRGQAADGLGDGRGRLAGRQVVVRSFQGVDDVADATRDGFESGAHAPEGDEKQQVRQGHDEHDAQQGATNFETRSHGRRAGPHLFPVSPTPPPRGAFPEPFLAPKGRPGEAREAVAGAVGSPQGLTSLNDLSPSMQGAVRAAHPHASAPVRAEDDAPHSKEAMQMEAPTYVLKDGDLAKPVAVVQPRALRGTLTSPELGAEWRPGAGVRAPTPELPPQLLPRRIGVSRKPGHPGTFTASGVVAPSGARPEATHSRHPLSRPATRVEITQAVQRGGA